MDILSNVLKGLAQVLGILLDVYFWVVIIAAILSWVNPDPMNPIVRFFRQATEPLFSALRRKLPFLQAGGLDLSPLAVILIIVFLKYALVQSLFEIAAKMHS